MLSCVMSAIKCSNWGRDGDTHGEPQEPPCPFKVLSPLQSLCWLLRKSGHCTQSNTGHDIFNPNQMHIRRYQEVCMSHRLRG